MSNATDLAATVAGDGSSGPVTLHQDVINATAQQLRRMPADQSPLFQPRLFTSLPGVSRAAIHAAAPQVLANAPPASRPVTVDLSALDAIHGYEAGGSVDPRTGLTRLPAARLEVCGSALLTLSNVTTVGTLKWSPQRDFKAVRLVIPSAEVTGSYVQNILVGNRPIYLGTNPEPAENFSELSTAGLVDFPVCRAGIVISGTLSNTTLGGATNYYTVLFGYVVDGKQDEPLKGHMRRMAIPPTVLGAGASSVIALNPQDAFKVRKLAIDQSIAANFILTQVSIGNEPQLMSGDPVPAQAYADRAQDVWVDWDRCKTGQQIFLSVTNISGGSATFQGALLGDVDESAPF